MLEHALQEIAKLLTKFIVRSYNLNLLAN